MQTGVLLVNLGTPNSPAYQDVYKYLIEFLTDKRVMDLPWLWRHLLVRSLIVPRRYKQSAESYKKIWTENGSPLLFYGEKLKTLLQDRLGPNFIVELAMRYQTPSIKSALAKLMQVKLDNLIILPLFPQYASATTGSIHEQVMQELKKQLYIPKITFINNFATDSGFIEAFSSLADDFNMRSYDHILFSFHGLPQRQIKKMDEKCLTSSNCCSDLNYKNHYCYKAQCFATAQKIAERLNLSQEHYSICFQSRLGNDLWLKPYTNNCIHDLAKKNKKRVLVFCPAFVCDCLETTYEIGIEYANEFKMAGGETLDLIPGLNDHPKWIAALEKIIVNHSKFS